MQAFGLELAEIDDALGGGWVAKDAQLRLVSALLLSLRWFL
jgi:hypothetical protein